MKIDEVQSVVKDFLRKNFNQDAEIIKIKKTDEGWLSEGIIYEESSFIKSLGLPTKVKDKNIYEVIVSNDLEIISYSKKKEEFEE